MAGFYQITIGYASRKSTMSHPAAALNGSFHRFGCLRLDGPNPQPVDPFQRLPMLMPLLMMLTDSQIQAGDGVLSQVADRLQRAG